MRGGFYGTFTLRLDDKGRLTLPSRYRDDFAAGAMVSNGQDRCLYLFTLDGFDDFATDAYQADLTDEGARGFQRVLFSSTDEQRPDAQGRIGIALRLREYAVLDRDVTLVGAGKRMEVWGAAAWDTYRAAHEAPFSSPAKGVLDR